MKGDLFFDRSRWGWCSRRFYFAVINHAKHRPLFSERRGRQPFRKVRVGRWCIHVRIGEAS